MLQLACISMNLRQVPVEIDFHFDSGSLELMFEQRQGFGNDLVHTYIAEFRTADARKVQ